MKRILICFAVLIWALQAFACAGDISAESAILMDALTGAVYYEKAPNERRLIASTTKIMTALVVLEHGSLEDTVEIPAVCEQVGGSSMYLRRGERVTVRELLYGLLLLSGNDAALALALHCGNGDEAAFVMEMNLLAQRLGLGDTSFENPHGLDGERNYSTARDLARLAAYAMEDPVFREIVSTREITLNGRAMRSHNKLLWRLEGAVGVKTGYTKAAGRCLVSCAERKGRRFIAVTLAAPDDWQDHETLYSAVFHALEEHTLLKTGDTAAVLPVLTGGEAAVVYDGDFSMWLTPMEADTAEIRLYLPAFLYEMPPAGTAAGHAEILIRGRSAGSVGLHYRGRSESEH